MMSVSSMCWTHLWEFLFLISSSTWLLTHGKGQTSDLSSSSLSSFTDNNGRTSVMKVTCNGTKELDVCWNKLPPIKDQGIPANPKAVEEACKVFEAGMECVQNWSKPCLSKQEHDKLINSIIGALETYRFLCSDRKFRQDFLRYGDCYKKISHHWDECARKFIDSLKRVDHAKDVLSLCCVRFSYLHCVSDVASHFCPNATRFLQKLAESLVRAEMRSYHPTQCISVTERNCTGAKSGQSSIKYNSPFFYLSPSILHQLLSSPKEQLINSLNVLLQSGPFTHISTAALTFSEEIAKLFSLSPLSPTVQEPTSSASFTSQQPSC